jgi:hypothetical protein
LHLLDTDPGNDRTRGLRLRDLALPGLDAYGRDSRIERERHVEPLVFHALEPEDPAPRMVALQL